MVRFLRGSRASVLLFLVWFSLYGITGCGSGGKPGGPADQMSGSELEQAERLMFQVTKEHSLQRDP